MLDIGWTEILVIAIVLIIVVGPKDLPQMLRTFGRMTSKMRGMASEFRHQFDEALREADLDDVKNTIGDARKLNPMNTIRDAVNPLKQMGNEIKADLEKAGSSTTTNGATQPVTPARGEPVVAAPAASAEVVIPSATASAAAAASSASSSVASGEAVAAEPIKGAPVKKTAARAAKPTKTAAASETADVPKATGRKAAASKSSVTGAKTAGTAPAKKAATRKSTSKKDRA